MSIEPAKPIADLDLNGKYKQVLIDNGISTWSDLSNLTFGRMQELFPDSAERMKVNMFYLENA